jgi:hypothetical protein
MVKQRNGPSDQSSSFLVEKEKKTNSIALPVAWHVKNNSRSICTVPPLHHQNGIIKIFVVTASKYKFRHKRHRPTLLPFSVANYSKKKRLGRNREQYETDDAYLV